MKRKEKPLTSEEVATIKRVANSSRLLSHVLKKVRATKRADQRFDINLAEGMEMEDKVKSLLTGKQRVEVKRDFKVSETDHMAIEFECNDKPSGIQTSESDWYALALDGPEFNGEVIIFITTERLKRLVKSGPGRTLYGGDKNLSHFKLIRVDRLLLDNSSIKDYEQWAKNKLGGSRRLKKV